MPDTLFTFEQIAAAVCGHWAEALPEDLATAYPGVLLATETLSEWCELSLEEWAPAARRDGDPEQARVLLRLRFFVRPGAETGRVLQLAEQGRAAFSSQNVPIVEEELSDGAIGWICFDAGELRDFSRADADQKKPALRHAEWMWRGSVRG